MNYYIGIIHPTIIDIATERYPKLTKEEAIAELWIDMEENLHGTTK